MKNLRFTLFFLLALPAMLYAQKVPLDNNAYDIWKSMGAYAISEDGKWITFEINPQQGDGWLYIYNVSTREKDSVFCGTGARIAPDSKYMAWRIIPTYGDTRQAKKKKLKDDQLPKNNLGIRVLSGDSIIIIKRVKSFLLPESNSLWMAYLLEKKVEEKKAAKEPADSAKSTRISLRNTKKPPEPKGTELVIYNPVTNKEFRYSDVTDYIVARDGKTISYLQDIPDTSKTDLFKVNIFDTKKETSSVVFESKGTVKKLVTDKSGDKVSFIFSADTAKVKIYSLFLSKSGEKASKIIDSSNPAMPAGWSVSENGGISFSEDGTREFFGTAEKPVKEPEDTLLPDEKYRLDIWSWDDEILQPQQKKQLDQELKKTYLAVYHIDKNIMIQLATKDIPGVRTMEKGNNDIALGSADLKYQKLSSWDANNYSDYYFVNVETGAKTIVLEKAASRVSLSPSSKYLVYWDIKDRAWVSMVVATGVKKVISASIKVPLYDELTDTPSEPAPYGIDGWMDDEKHVLIRDRFDLWTVDLNGIETPVNNTNGFGRKFNLTFQYQKLDPDAEFIGKKETMYLSTFNNNNKESGFYTIKAGTIADPSLLVMGKCSYSRGITKAKKADKLIWAKGTFEISPELYVSEMNFSNAKKLSVTNPQQTKYNWGTVELVEWMSFDRQKLQGLLYKPENFDPSKKYPMIVYFYERSSDGLYTYNAPAPSASIINRTFAVSNGYLVFVPDIPYVIGYPGQSCYNSVVSGTYALLERYSFIDKDRLGLDGQSWGGYQIAYLVTQTDLFACAYSGAAVVNMISAYGGIRWGTGVSRMFQYEHTQSRIGGTLWEKPLEFIENSPIFWIPKINTPLLLMHNDADGAVPWYQGIEFITALRRLDKPAWLLSYNDEDHNLVKRPNRKDISIRKMQFFDHYLKDAPMPYWMKYGISQVEKGKTDGYQLINEK
jgi:dipeptidyl aminopeptidase/acylaminoacyl peptidase